MRQRETPRTRPALPVEATALSIRSLVAGLALALGLLTLTTPRLLLAVVVGAAVVSLLERQPRRRATFDFVGVTLAATAALAVFRAVAADGSRPRESLAVIAAVGAYALVGSVLASIWAVAAERRAPLGQYVRAALQGVLGSAGTATFVVVGYRLEEVDPTAAVLLVAPIALSIAALRAYARTRSRHEHLEFLYESMREVQSADGFRDAADQLLHQLTQMLRAEFAELVFLGRSDSGEVQVLTRSGPDLKSDTRAIRPEERLVLIHAALSDRSLLLDRGHRSHPLDGYLRSRGLDDALVAPLRGEERELGAIVVGNRTGPLGGFSAEDCRLFETFSAHAAVLLENDQLERSLVQLTKLEGKLRHQAYHDALTGLANREAFIEATTDAVARGRKPTVLFVDLDDFKLTNDTLGHAAGDELLRVAAQRVSGCLRAGDLAARLGGDEFAVLLYGADLPEAEDVARRISERLDEPAQLHGQECSLRGSIGIAQATAGGDAATLLRDADLAMYAAKELGTGSYSVFRPEMQHRIHARHTLAAALGHSLERDEIVVAYQPIVSLDSGAVPGFEALVRWQRGTASALLPTQFLEVAEQTGMLAPIGRFVLAEACRRAAEWNALGRPVSVNVNLSASELRDPTLARELETLIGAAGLDPGKLTLEITEAAAMTDPEETIPLLTRLRQLGVRIALDDFGTGFSSLSYLEAMPVDMLKIPKQLVDGLRGESPRTVILGGIHALARSLGLALVAEGVEAPEQLERLRELGYAEAQGFLLSPPLPADEAERLLQRRELRAVRAGTAA